MEVFMGKVGQWATNIHTGYGPPKPGEMKKIIKEEEEEYARQKKWKNQNKKK